MRLPKITNPQNLRELHKQTYDAERALYASRGIKLVDCEFKGEADGESALKECKNVVADGCLFDLRYPLWHCSGVSLINCTQTPDCRAALWYSADVIADRTVFGGIKAFRECARVKLGDCRIDSPEFGWKSRDITLENCTAKSEYFMFEAQNLNFTKLTFSGKYSFQYIKNAEFNDCDFNTKDAFWHSKDVTVKNSLVKGEYLGWYSRNLTFVNCTIIGTQPLCYCKNLKLVDCKMIDTDLAFEKSEVWATVESEIVSVKNPLSGTIVAKHVNALIRDDAYSQAVVVSGNEKL